MATANDTTLIYSDFGADEDLAELVEMFADEIPARVQSMMDAAESLKLGAARSDSPPNERGRR